MSLPAVPDKDITPRVAAGLERRVARDVQQIDDVSQLLEWQRRSEALSAYLKDKEAAPYIWGSLRRIEARIGELIGPGKHGGDRSSKSSTTDLLRDKDLRSDFRQLADLVRRGLLKYDEDGDESPWRSSRRALLLYELLQNMGGLKSSQSVEWYTPARYIEAAREVMGGIDLDPASSKLANETVKAARYFDEKADGLAQEWRGRVWLNPPYGKGSGLFTLKLAEEHRAGRVSAAVLLLNAYGFDTEWFQQLWGHPICFTDHRIEFTSPLRGSGGPANGNLFVYFGAGERDFQRVFKRFGHVVRVWDDA